MFGFVSKRILSMISTFEGPGAPSVHWKQIRH
jgi:hypothetical protein